MPTDPALVELSQLASPPLQELASQAEPSLPVQQSVTQELHEATSSFGSDMRRHEMLPPLPDEAIARSIDPIAVNINESAESLLHKPKSLSERALPVELRSENPLQGLLAVSQITSAISSSNLPSLPTASHLTQPIAQIASVAYLTASKVPTKYVPIAPEALSPPNLFAAAPGISSLSDANGEALLKERPVLKSIPQHSQFKAFKPLNRLQKLSATRRIGTVRPGSRGTNHFIAPRDSKPSPRSPVQDTQALGSPFSPDVIPGQLHIDQAFDQEPHSLLVSRAQSLISEEDRFSNAQESKFAVEGLGLVGSAITAPSGSLPPFISQASDKDGVRPHPKFASKGIQRIRVARRAPSQTSSVNNATPSKVVQDDSFSSVVPLVPLSIPVPNLTSSSCLDSSTLSPSLGLPMTAPPSPLLPSSPISPSIEAFASPSIHQDAHFQSQTARAQTHNRTEAMAPFIAAIVLGSVLSVSVAAWLAWLFRRSRKRALVPPISNLPPPVAYNDEKYGGGNSGKYGKKRSSRIGDRSPSLSLPDHFYSSRRVPLDHEAQWTASIDKTSQQARNSVSALSDNSSFISTSDGASTCLEVQSIETSHTSLESHAQRKSITLGGTTFVVEATPATRRSRTQSDPHDQHWSTRASDRASTKSFGATMRSLKKGTRPRSVSAGERPIKPPRSSLRPLTQLIYAGDFSFDTECSAAITSAMKSASEQVDDDPNPLSNTTIITISQNQPQTRRSSYASSWRSSYQTKNSRYSDYYPSEVFNTKPIARKAIGHLSREDSMVIDPIVQDKQPPALPQLYETDFGNYYKSMTRAQEDDLVTNYDAASVISLEHRPLNHDESVYTLKDLNPTAVDLDTSTSGLVAQFPVPPIVPQKDSITLEKTLMNFSDADIAALYESTTSGSSDLDPTSYVVAIPETAQVKGTRASEKGFIPSTPGRSRTVSTVGGTCVSSRRRKSANSEASAVRASFTPTNIARNSNVSAQSEISSSISDLSAHKIEFAATGTRQSARSTKKTGIPAPVPSASVRDATASETEEESDLWKLARARVRARASGTISQ